MSTKPSTYTAAHVLTELADLGINLRRHEEYPYNATASIQYLHEEHPDVLERVIASIRHADNGTLTSWKRHFRMMTLISYRSAESDYERMIANAGLTQNLLDAMEEDIIPFPDRFQTTVLALNLEYTTGIKPGDPRYGEVQAAIVYAAIAHPNVVVYPSPGTADEWYSFADSRALKLIAENMDEIMPVLSQLCQRGDASPETIEAMLSVTPSLAEGLL